MALAGAALLWLLLPVARTMLAAGDADLFYWFYLSFLPQFVVINLYLMFFNLLPIPPLDGSSILAVLLPPKHLGAYYAMQRYAMPIFLIVAFVLPSATGINPFAWYLNVTAGELATLMMPF